MGNMILLLREPYFSKVRHLLSKLSFSSKHSIMGIGINAIFWRSCLYSFWSGFPLSISSWSGLMQYFEGHVSIPPDRLETSADVLSDLVAACNV